MIRTTCPKCGREDAVADYLASLPIMCNGCGTRVNVGEPIAARPMFSPPPPPKVVVPPPAPPPAPSPPKAVAPPPTRPKPVPPPPVVAPPPPVAVPEELVKALDEIVPPLDEPEPVTLQQMPPALPFPLAGVGRRLLARFLFLLGLALMVGLGFGVIVFAPKSVTRDPMIMYAILAALPAIYLLVNAAMLARTGQDVGKRYAGIRIVNADGSPANEKTALLKRDALTFVIGLTGIGLLYWLANLVTLFSKGGRCLHDRIAGTRVVRA